MQRSFSIITVSKSRLEHVKLSLPKMLAQPGAEVIVVDYSCPQRTGDYVEEHFPSARVVRAGGEAGFSNWKGRNLGASAATGNVLVFCDADTVMADGAVSWIAEQLPERSFGSFNGPETLHLNARQPGLAENQLLGFLAVPARIFRALGGYDEVLRGYAAGGDTDLLDRLLMSGVRFFSLDPKIIESVVPHADADRTQHHPDPVRLSYGAGLLYREAKHALMRLRSVNLPLQLRQNLYERAYEAAGQLGSGQDRVSLSIDVDQRPVGMPRQLGFQRGTQKLTIRVDVGGEGKL